MSRAPLGARLVISQFLFLWERRPFSAGSAVRLAPKPGFPARQSAFNPTAFARLPAI
jgi:hypothetical protein